MIKFRGRELSFREKGFEIMETFISGLESYKIEKSPEMMGRTILAIIAPNIKKNWQAAALLNKMQVCPI